MINPITQFILLPTPKSSFVKVAETDELLLHIFSFLNEEEQISVQNVNRRWREIALDRSLWKEYCYFGNEQIKKNPIPYLQYELSQVNQQIVFFREIIPTMMKTISTLQYHSFSISFRFPFTQKPQVVCSVEYKQDGRDLFPFQKFEYLIWDKLPSNEEWPTQIHNWATTSSINSCQVGNIDRSLGITATFPNMGLSSYFSQFLNHSE